MKVILQLISEIKISSAFKTKLFRAQRMLIQQTCKCQQFLIVDSVVQLMSLFSSVNPFKNPKSINMCFLSRKYTTHNSYSSNFPYKNIDEYFPYHATESDWLIMLFLLRHHTVSILYLIRFILPCSQMIITPITAECRHSHAEQFNGKVFVPCN